jgi:hypothetical protein
MLGIPGALKLMLQVGDQACEWLERAYAQRDGGLTRITAIRCSPTQKPQDQGRPERTPPVP